MSDDDTKPTKIEAPKEGEHKAQRTTQKTADEAVTDAPMAQKYEPKFTSFSEGMQALSPGMKAVSPLVLEDSATGETFYDASKSKSASKAHAKDSSSQLLSEKSETIETKHSHPLKGPTNHDAHIGDKHVDPVHRQTIQPPGHTDKHVDTVHKPTSKPVEQPLARKHNEGVENVRPGDRAVNDATTHGEKAPLAKPFMVLVPDFKTGRPVPLEFGPGDAKVYQEHLKENLHGKDLNSLNDFDKKKVLNLTLCDTMLDKYEHSLSGLELNDAKMLPEQSKGFFLAGMAVTDGATLGAARATIHKVIEGGALEQLANGAGMGLLISGVLVAAAKFAVPWVRVASMAFQGGGLVLALNEVKDIGMANVNGFLTSVPDLEKVIHNPSAENLRLAKNSVDKNLGGHLADAALFTTSMIIGTKVGKIAAKHVPPMVVAGEGAEIAGGAKMGSALTAGERMPLVKSILSPHEPLPFKSKPHISEPETVVKLKPHVQEAEIPSPKPKSHVQDSETPPRPHVQAAETTSVKPKPHVIEGKPADLTSKPHVQNERPASPHIEDQTVTKPNKIVTHPQEHSPSNRPAIEDQTVTQPQKIIENPNQKPVSEHQSLEEQSTTRPVKPLENTGELDGAKRPSQNLENEKSAKTSTEDAHTKDVIDAPEEMVRDYDGAMVHKNLSYGEATDLGVGGAKSESIRTIKLPNGENYTMNQNDRYFGYGESPQEVNAPIKVHILTESAKDLNSIQSKLIPKLIYEDPVLGGLVKYWKTIDPNFGVGKNGIGRGPTGTDQGAKGFTMYAKNAEEALMIRDRLVDICKKEGLELGKKLETGNCEKVDEITGRVGISRDYFKLGISDDGRKGALLDPALIEKIHADPKFAINDGERLSVDQLNELQKLAGIKEGLLCYSKNGELMLKGTVGNPQSGNWYAAESGARTEAGFRTERPALYALFDLFKLDPVDSALKDW